MLEPLGEFPSDPGSNLQAQPGFGQESARISGPQLDILTENNKNGALLVNKINITGSYPQQSSWVGKKDEWPVSNMTLIDPAPCLGQI
jgi:hypothetical protein